MAQKASQIMTTCQNTSLSAQLIEVGVDNNTQSGNTDSNKWWCGKLCGGYCRSELQRNKKDASHTWMNILYCTDERWTFLLLMLCFYYSIMLTSFFFLRKLAVDKQACRSQFCSLHWISWFEPLKQLTPAALENCDLASRAKNMLCKVRNLKCWKITYWFVY